MLPKQFNEVYPSVGLDVVKAQTNGWLFNDVRRHSLGGALIGVGAGLSRHDREPSGRILFGQRVQKEPRKVPVAGAIFRSER